MFSPPPPVAPADPWSLPTEPPLPSTSSHAHGQNVCSADGREPNTRTALDIIMLRSRRGRLSGVGWASWCGYSQSKTPRPASAIMRVHLSSWEVGICVALSDRVIFRGWGLEESESVSHGTLTQRNFSPLDRLATPPRPGAHLYWALRFVPVSVRAHAGVRLPFLSHRVTIGNAFRHWRKPIKSLSKYLSNSFREILKLGVSLLVWFECSPQPRTNTDCCMKAKLY